MSLQIGDKVWVQFWDDDSLPYFDKVTVVNIKEDTVEVDKRFFCSTNECHKEKRNAIHYAICENLKTMKELQRDIEILMELLEQEK